MCFSIEVIRIMLRIFAVFGLTVGFTGCEAAEVQPLLQVDVKTDYVPGEDFDSIRVELGRGDVRVDLEHIVDLGGDYLRGRRIGSGVVGEGDIDIVARMVQDGNVVTSREVSITVRGAVSVATIVITRNCGRVECPAVGGDAVLSSCYGGRCADPRCTVETPEFCPVLCSSDAECASSGCREGRCEGGVCFSVPSDAQCPSGDRCNADGICIEGGRDAGSGPDGGIPDSGGLDASATDSGAPDRDSDVPDGGGCSMPCEAGQVCIAGDCIDDLDGDGFVSPADCDDNSDEVFPGAMETCNGIDDDCDMDTDESDVCSGCTAWTEGGSFYLLCPRMVTWQAAVDECRSRDLVSVTVDDVAENARLAARIGDVVWLGLNDRSVEGTFVWESGSASTFENWDANEPNNFGGGEDCAAMRGDALWNDAPCDAIYMPLCESP